MKRNTISKKKRKLKPKIKIAFTLLVCAIISCIVVFFPNIKEAYKQAQRIKTLSSVELPSWITENIIDIHGSARTGNKLKKLNNIVVHYVGNPNTTAAENRDYFNNSATEVSSHFVVGLEGEIIQCLPLNEISAASNHRNIDTISIEVCHPDESGRFNELTYSSLTKLLSWLCSILDMSAEDIIRHYDVTGKLCPIYYVENPQEWDALITDVRLQIDAIG